MLLDEEAERERDKLRDKAAHEDAWRWVLGDERGRLVLAQIIRASNPLGVSYVAADALGTAFREGQRHAGTLIYQTVMDMQPAMWAVMHRLVTTGDEIGADVPTK